MYKESGIKKVKPYILLAPFLLLYMLFTIFPVLKGIQMSFYDWNLFRKMEFVGLKNYERMINDHFFWDSIWNTTFFVMISTPVMIVIALALALLANVNSKLKTLYRSAFFLPSILSVSVISYVAVFVVQPYTGLLSTGLNVFGIEREFFFQQDPVLVWVFITGTTLWWTVGFNMILYLSALQDIPKHLYEAADIDGAARWTKFRYITLPLLKPITFVILLLQILASYKVFAQIFLMTGGGPGTETRPIIQYIYETGFVKNNLGYSAAMSYGLFIILVLVTVIQFKVTRKRGG
ncbi:carbohydrate ABC transporter permease [Metabacillus arenae]|uniref:Sugar ABC transporter permease n=1 Tax=Metabacillus arenae TaxID=2771434 RepID=A0A926NID3_9BACI|nr:sugar ABC transporter permease [Metabacillus arenae]MBD1381896.1 sugar ABC transporter permease [Metabacillus arenae]